MKRRGMSQIITTVIMIGIVLVAIGAVWVVAQNILSEGLEDVSLGSLKVNLDIENVKVTDTGIDVKVKRNSGEANLVGINFIVSDGENTEVFEEETDMKELATQTFSLDYSGVVRSVEVAPVLANDEGKEKVYDSVDVEELSVEQSLTGLGVVSWWKLDGNVRDEIGENDGEIVGNIDCSFEGAFGEACYNSGSNSNYVVFSGSGSLKDINDDGNSFSLSCWFSPKGLPQYVQSGYVIYRPGYHFGIAQIKSNGATRADLWYSDNTNMFSDVSSALEQGKWYNLMMVVDEDSNELKYYINGEQIGNTKTITKPLREYSTDWILFGTGDYTSNGLIDNVQIFNKALTEEQVKGLYNLDLS